MPRQSDTPFGKQILEARLVSGLSLRKAAGLIGVSHPRLIEFETGVDMHSGRPVRPAYPTVLRIAEVYGLEAEALLTLAGYALPSQDPAERRLVDAFRALPPEEREILLRDAERLLLEKSPHYRKRGQGGD